MTSTPTLSLCDVCRTPIHPANLASGYTTHPSCDENWRSRMRVVTVEAGSLEVWPCSQEHEAALYTDSVQLATSCEDCRSKLYPKRTHR